MTNRFTPIINNLLPSGISTTDNLTVTGDSAILGKLDIGVPGVSGGLDVGEGGSFNIGLNVYTYDASAASGSRFTQITDLNATNILPSDAGDRIYYGYVNKFWGCRHQISIPKSSSEKYILKYWNGTLKTSSYMGILKDVANSIGEDILLQTTQKEYLSWDIDINSDWVVVDDTLDEIPNVGTANYWVCLEVPTGGIATAPTVTEIKIRGSDFDVVSGTSFTVFWGLSRIAILERITLDIRPGGGGAIQDQLIATGMNIRVVSFDNVNDDVGFMWVLPDGIDTSCGLIFLLDYISENAQTLTINLKLKKLKTGILTGSGESTDLDEDTEFTVATVKAFKANQSLNVAPFSIQNINSGDSVGIEVTMKVMPITGGTNEFIPTSFKVLYYRWTSGKHVGE